MSRALVTPSVTRAVALILRARSAGKWLIVRRAWDDPIVRSLPCLLLVACGSVDLPSPPPAPAPAPSSSATLTSAIATTPASRRSATGTIEEVAVPGDRPLHVVRGTPGRERPIVFLHGSCTPPDAYLEAFTKAATTHGGVIALEGELPCKEDPRLRRWAPDTSITSARIETALHAMDLPTDDVTLVGYSQGAERAEWLANRFPAKYTRFVLVAGPIVPSPARFHHARAVALLAGRGDVRGNMADGARALRRASIPAIYMELEGASPHHGQLAPEADGAFAQAFDWIQANGISKTPRSK